MTTISMSGSFCIWMTWDGNFPVKVYYVLLLLLFVTKSIRLFIVRNYNKTVLEILRLPTPSRTTLSSSTGTSSHVSGTTTHAICPTDHQCESTNSASLSHRQLEVARPAKTLWYIAPAKTSVETWISIEGTPTSEPEYHENQEGSS